MNALLRKRAKVGQLTSLPDYQGWVDDVFKGRIAPKIKLKLKVHDNVRQNSFHPFLFI